MEIIFLLHWVVNWKIFISNVFSPSIWDICARFSLMLLVFSPSVMMRHQSGVSKPANRVKYFQFEKRRYHRMHQNVSKTNVTDNLKNFPILSKSCESVGFFISHHMVAQTSPTHSHMCYYRYTQRYTSVHAHSQCVEDKNRSSAKLNGI